MKKFHVFDLDGTVIDSFHRVSPCLEANGDLNLVKYIREACTFEQVMKDTLLPLAGHMVNLIAKGENVAICTARNMFKHDYVFLRKHGLRVPFIMSRDNCTTKEHYKKSDAEYKSEWLDKFKTQHSVTDFVLYDDNRAVLAMADSRADVKARDAIAWNKFLETIASKSSQFMVV